MISELTDLEGVMPLEDTVVMSPPLAPARRRKKRKRAASIRSDEHGPAPRTAAGTIRASSPRTEGMPSCKDSQAGILGSSTAVEKGT